MEWGNFWSSHLPRTSYDIDLDSESPNPNDQVRFCCSRIQLLDSGWLKSDFGNFDVGFWENDIRNVSWWHREESHSKDVARVRYVWTYFFQAFNTLYVEVCTVSKACIVNIDSQTNNWTWMHILFKS